MSTPIVKDTLLCIGVYCTEPTQPDKLLCPSCENAYLRKALEQGQKEAVLYNRALGASNDCGEA